MMFIILSWKDRRTPRFLLDVVGSHEHNSQWCMNCWFVLTFQQRSVWRILFKKIHTHTHTQKKHKVFNNFNFQFLPRNLPFSTFQNPTGWTIRSPGKPEIPTFWQEPHMHWALLWEIRRPQMWSDQINGSSLDWKTRSVFELEESILFWHLFTC